MDRIKEETMGSTATATPRLIGASEVAAMLGCSRERVLALVSEGALTSVRFGARGWHRFRREDVERLLAGEHPHE
jgi:excisionase family DNA binding protein